MVQTIQQSGDQLLEILNGILDLSRIESGRLEIEERTFDLGDLLKAADALFAPQAAEKGLSFRIEAGPEAEGFFVSDPTRIRQILYNLLGNALKFTTTGEIVVSAEVARPAGETGARRELTLAVRDTGIGIPADKIERVFQPFTQADGSTTRLFGGTGLGLSIAAQLAGLLGGSITVDSTVGVGSTFTARMRVEADAKATDEAPRPEAPSDWTARTPIRILVAEDNHTNQLVLSEQLRPLGVEATIVENGRLAVDTYAAGRFDLVLLDIHMPVMDGIDAAREIRSLESQRGGARTPIFAVTANAMPHQVALYHAAGMDGHVAKPIRPYDLIRVFAGVLAEKTGKAPQRVAGTGAA
jgi:CheY-like chemotaxis protein